jgi:hypothetical protein
MNTHADGLVLRLKQKDPKTGEKKIQSTSLFCITALEGKFGRTPRWYYTGCRLGAAQEIRWPMVSADATEIKIPGALMKAKFPLTIVLAGAGLEAVAKLLKKDVPKKRRSRLRYEELSR